MDKSKGGNMSTVKLENRKLILNVLKNSGALSRLDIAQMIELTPAAITILVNEMVREGIIIEVGQLEEKDKRSGRKKVLLDLNCEHKYVIGINIEADKINIGIANMRGDVKCLKSLAVDRDLTPEELLKNAAAQCMNMMWKENILKERLLGIGIGIVGLVDEINGISKHAYGLWKSEVNVKKIIEDILGINVVVDNNVRTIALGQLDYHSSDSEDKLFIKYGPGIGSEIIIDNKIYYGSHKYAGEIGHTIVDYNGKLCRCGKRGCLETVASQSSIISKVKEIFSSAKTPILFETCGSDIGNINMQSICDAAELGDVEIIAIIQKAVFYMAVAIGNTISLFDPHKVILYGEAFKYKVVMEELKKDLAKIIVNSVEDDFITLSELNNRSNYIGAIALALREFFYNTGGM